jgi:hypothetical protein
MMQDLEPYHKRSSEICMLHGLHSVHELSVIRITGQIPLVSTANLEESFFMFLAGQRRKFKELFEKIDSWPSTDPEFCFRQIMA